MDNEHRKQHEEKARHQAQVAWIQFEALLAAGFTTTQSIELVAAMLSSPPPIVIMGDQGLDTSMMTGHGSRGH